MHRYRREFCAGIPVPEHLPGYLVRTLVSRSDWLLLHHLLREVYAHGFGWVPPYEAWWEALSNDEEYDPGLIMLAFDSTGVLAAGSITWTSSFIKDLAVSNKIRRRGLASALLLQTFQALRQRGILAVDLKVDAGNDAAIALYEKIGMRRVETLIAHD